MRNKERTLLGQNFFIATVFVLGFNFPAQALSIFTDRDEFLNAVSNKNYCTDDFSSLPDYDYVDSPYLVDCRRAFFFPIAPVTISASGNPLPSFFGLFGVSPSGNNALSTNVPEDSLSFGGYFRLPVITAVGGYFFSTNESGEFMPATVTVSLAGNSIIWSQVVSEPTQFFGVKFPEEKLIISVSDGFATADDIIVNGYVPEPLTLLGASSAAIFGVSFKRYLSRHR
ncbi:MAG: hypothetical protein RLZZ490_2052 [Cyanobacteriota bacterium]|jgi:hypothetical protein